MNRSLQSNITLQYGNECLKENKPLPAKSLNENRAEVSYRSNHRIHLPYPDPERPQSVSSQTPRGASEIRRYIEQVR